MLKRIEVARNDQPPPKEDPSPTKDVPSLSVEELAAQIANGSGVQIVDARQRDHMSRHMDLMAGATWRDPDRVEEWIAELTPDTPVAVYCSYGFDVGAQRDEDAHRARLRRALHPRRASPPGTRRAARGRCGPQPIDHPHGEEKHREEFHLLRSDRDGARHRRHPLRRGGRRRVACDGARAQGRQQRRAPPRTKAWRVINMRALPSISSGIRSWQRPVNSSTRPARSRLALNGLPGGIPDRRSRTLAKLAAEPAWMPSTERRMPPPSTICSPPMVARMVPP